MRCHLVGTIRHGYSYYETCGMHDITWHAPTGPCNVLYPTCSPWGDPERGNEPHAHWQDSQSKLAKVL